MSLEYAERRIKEALRQSGGNAAKARRQVIAWTFEDAKLLQALTQHHLSGIVAYHVERIAAPAITKKRAASGGRKTPTPKGRDEFGRDLLKAVASSDAAVFGLEGYLPGGRRNPASAQHKEAIRRLASGRRLDPNKSRKK